MNTQTGNAHEWEMDGSRTRLDINVIVYRCRSCGCLQIKNGGPDARSVFKPGDPGWNPFRSLPTEPPCRQPARRDEPHFAQAGAS
jgi:hypothetical protein